MCPSILKAPVNDFLSPEASRDVPLLRGEFFVPRRRSFPGAFLKRGGLFAVPEAARRSALARNFAGGDA